MWLGAVSILGCFRGFSKWSPQPHLSSFSRTAMQFHPGLHARAMDLAQAGSSKTRVGWATSPAR